LQLGLAELSDNLKGFPLHISRRPSRIRGLHVIRAGLAAAAVLLIVSGELATAGETAAPSATPARADRTYPALQAFADRVVREGRVPGVTIAIGRGDGPPTFIAAGRISTDTSAALAGADTLWRAYSMTKPVTGVAAMILIDDGKLGLDQPISDFIPEFKSVHVFVDAAKGGETRPAAREITVRHLLTHTSGVGYPQFSQKPLADALNAAGLVPFSFGTELELAMRPKRPTSLIEFARRRAAIPLAYDPGSKFAYSMSLDVLAAVIERASGMPYETFLQKRLLGPLRMRSTYWQVPGSEVRRFADTLSKEPAAPLKVAEAAANSPYLDPPSFPYGGAGLVSSARDYDRFLHMLQNGGTLNGKRILSRRTATLAMSNLLPPDVNYSNFGPIPRNEPTGFGAGGFVTILETDAFGRKRGTFGWDGAAGTRAWVNAREKVRVTMMINVLGGLDLLDPFEKAVATDLN
jgi:CubicO group peptidase (beta-lactamase class C family)